MALVPSPHSLAGPQLVHALQVLELVAPYKGRARSLQTRTQMCSLLLWNQQKVLYSLGAVLASIRSDAKHILHGALSHILLACLFERLVSASTEGRVSANLSCMHSGVHLKNRVVLPQVHLNCLLLDGCLPACCLPACCLPAYLQLRASDRTWLMS